ncbi:hypothetical protein RDWZM_003742 [Blomia tropicalis]|uniref:Uncharacterized protein n=1 Tax=Blomia tropicalis TaxID=40697 RepID=A0A9Q0MIV2_BLOTA|nr:hypothetical protein RDWZM_003742 [Blomia tropicalis]
MKSNIGISINLHHNSFLVRICPLTISCFPHYYIQKPPSNNRRTNHYHHIPLQVYDDDEQEEEEEKKNRRSQIILVYIDISTCLHTSNNNLWIKLYSSTHEFNLRLIYIVIVRLYSHNLTETNDNNDNNNNNE